MSRKIFNLVMVLSLIAAVVLLFMEAPMLQVRLLVLVTLGISIVLLFYSPGGRKTDTAIRDEEADEDRINPEEQYAEEKEVLKKELEQAKEDARFWKTSMESIYNSFLAFESTLPIVEKLSGLVTSKSEQSTVDLTHNIFSIAEVSRDVSEKVHTLLREMTEGDRSLERNISKLESEIDTLSGMEEAFLTILHGYRGEMKSLSSTIVSIKDFTEALTDLSERTHILAINASVEAARVGTKGAGFAVIAGEVQKLAAHSKEIAASIRELTGRIDNQVHGSFRAQGEQIDSAVRGIQTSKGDVGEMVRMFGPQAKMISESIGESKRLSDNVTENLNRITVSLQFQDYIRQVVEHIIAILKDQNEECKKNFPADKLERRKISTILYEEAKEKAGEYFTIRDEWETVGLTFEENKVEKEEKTEMEDFGGDVSLF